MTGPGWGWEAAEDSPAIMHLGSCNAVGQGAAIQFKPYSMWPLCATNHKCCKGTYRRIQGGCTIAQSLNLNQVGTCPKAKVGKVKAGAADYAAGAGLTVYIYTIAGGPCYRIPAKDCAGNTRVERCRQRRDGGGCNNKAGKRTYRRIPKGCPMPKGLDLYLVRTGAKAKVCQVKGWAWGDASGWLTVDINLV